MFELYSDQYFTFGERVTYVIFYLFVCYFIYALTKGELK